jgi:hypothetical protein
MNIKQQQQQRHQQQSAAASAAAASAAASASAAATTTAAAAAAQPASRATNIKDGPEYLGELVIPGACVEPAHDNGGAVPSQVVCVEVEVVKRLQVVLRACAPARMAHAYARTPHTHAHTRVA